MNKNITSKGPWEALKTFNRATEQQDVVVLDNKGLVVAYFGFLSRKENTDTDRLRLSNAKLVSKAPEMLQMLINLDREGGLGLDRHAAIQKLIEEATEL